MKNNIVSIIIPVYKVERYLAKCVDSVIHQTYADLEIILVDDGSPDNCPRMCDDFAKKDERIKVIHKSNGGLSDARNVGLDAASGDYIFFLDSDDYLDEELIERLLISLTENGCDLSVCNLFRVDENGSPLVRADQLPIRDGVIDRTDALKNLSRVQGGYYNVACCKLYRKELFDEIRFPLNVLHEDEFVAHKIFLGCGRIACVGTRYYYYLVREGSIMNSGVTTIREIDVSEAYLDRAGIMDEVGLTAESGHYLWLSAIHAFGVYICLTEENEIRRAGEVIDEIKKVFSKLRKNCDFRQKIQVGLVCSCPEICRRSRVLRHIVFS